MAACRRANRHQHARARADDEERREADSRRCHDPICVGTARQACERGHQVEPAPSGADIAGTAQGDYRTQDKGPGWADLNGTFARGKAQAAHKYLPVSVGPSVRAWLREALLNGSASDGKFVLKGNLYDFPFADNKGGSF